MQSVVTGQAPIAPITLERKITPGGKQIKQKIMHTIAETNRIHQTKKKDRSAYVCTYHDTYDIYTSIYMRNEAQQKPKPRRQHSTHKKKTG